MVDINYVTTNPLNRDKILEAAIDDLQNTLSPNFKSAPKVQIFGDSITQQNTVVVGGQSSYSQIGYFTWAQTLSGARSLYDPGGNFGISGNTTTQMVSRLSTALEYVADVVIVHGGTNDISVDTDPSVIIANLKNIYDSFVNNGKKVIVIPILPRSQTITTARNQSIAKVNTWIKGYVQSKKGLYLADPWPYLVDQASSTAAPLPSMFSDGLHPSPTGAYWIGVTVADVIKQLYPPLSTRFTNPADVYDLTNNPTGNLLVNGCLSGSSAVSGSGRSGTVPTSWDLARLSGTGSATVAAQASTGPLPGFECVTTIALTGQSSFEVFALTQTVNAGGSTYSSGDNVYLEGEIQVSGTVLNMSGCSLVFLDHNGVTPITVADMQTVGQLQPNFGGYTMYLRTPVRVIAPYGGSGTQRIIVRAQVSFDATVSASATIIFRNLALRKVIQ